MVDNNTYVFSGKDLSIDDVKTILDYNLKIELSNQVKSLVNQNRSFLESKIEKNNHLFYGINTGFGSLCNHVISNDELKKLQLNLVRSHSCGAGDEIDSILVKLMILLKINSLSKGYSGIKLDTIERLAFLFNNNIFPVVYESGSLGASGDLAPLAHLSLAIIGEGYVNYNGERLKTKDLYRELKLKPIELGAKEGLALLNGTQFMSAHGTYAALKMDKVFNWVNKIASISLDAYNCRLDPFDEKVHRVRPYKGQQISAKLILKTLNGSELINVKEKDVQDPYSFRCIPQVHGASLDILENLKKTLEIEINSVTDNPILFEESDEVISAGNFHGQPLALAMDFMSIAIAEIGSISEGKRADLVMWDPAFFGVKPEMVLLSGTIVSAQMGDPNASIPTPQPVYSRPMFGAFGRSVERSAVTFVSEAAYADDIGNQLGLSKDIVAVENTRNIGKSDLILNNALPVMEVNPETYEVRADGELLTCEPAKELAMAQRYFLF